VTEFTKEDLLEVTPEVVRQWMNDVCFGDPFPAEGAKPLCRSTNLAYLKKAVSFYMPNKRPHWMEGLGGNPTKSSQVNDLIAHVEKLEVRGLGVPSQAKRALRQAEYKWTVDNLRRGNSVTNRYKYPCMMNAQFHIIGRGDDICNQAVTDLRGHDEFDGCLKTKVAWSKNVRSERVCPDQIIFASRIEDYCAHLHYAIYLEFFLASHPMSELMFTHVSRDENPNSVENLKNCYRNRLVELWKDADFQALVEPDDVDVGLGVHSMRKVSSFYNF
jgi:hypothetical protein